MKKKAIKILLITVGIILILSIIQSLYLTVRLTKLRLDKYNDVPYVQNNFISQELYDDLAQSVIDIGETRETLKEITTDSYKIGFTYTFAFFNRAHYSGNYHQKFDGITDDGEKIRFGSNAATYVDLEFVNFRWKAVKVWEDP
jgi:hypothetical protein